MAAVCTDTCIVERATANCSVSYVLVEATPLLDETLFQVVDVANPATVDALLERTPHLIGHRIYVRAIGRPQQRRDEIWCTTRQKLHGVISSMSWSIVLLESEEVSCYGTNRRQKVLTEQDVTLISAINFYTTPGSMNISSIVQSIKTVTETMKDHDRKWTEYAGDTRLTRAVSKLIGIFHIGNFCFLTSTAVAQELCGGFC